MGPGEACTAAGLTCPALNELGPQCEPAVQECTCENGVWAHCVFDGPILPGNGCVEPTCPAPANLAPGARCGLPQSMSCISDIAAADCNGNPIQVSCSCVSGAWDCPLPHLPVCFEEGPPDVYEPDVYEPPDVYVPDGPATCPFPDQVFQGLPCPAVGLECPGNPTLCQGAVFYDALECVNFDWVTLAATECGDAGPDAEADAGVSDAPVGSD